MATPLFDRSSSSSTRTTSPTDACPQQLRTASPDLNAGPSSVDRSESETKPAQDLQPLHTEGDEQEEIAGGRKSSASPSTVRYVNNPHGTTLTTIIERESNASLFEMQNRSQLPVRARVEQGLADVAVLSEFQSIVNGTVTSRSFPEEVKPLDRANGLADDVMVREQSIEVFDCQNRNKVLEDPGTCFSEHRSSPSTPSVPDSSRVALGQFSMKSRPECSSPKHLFHIFPDFIQLGSFSQHENSHHVQSNSTNTSSNDSTGTGYLPIGLIPPPLTHASRRLVPGSSVSARKSSGESHLSSVTYNTESVRVADFVSPPQSNQDEVDKTKVSRSLPLPLASKNESPPSDRQRVQQPSRQTSYESSLDDIREDYGVFVMANILTPISDQPEAFSSTQEQRPRIFSAAAVPTDVERSQSCWSRPSKSAPVNSTRESSRARSSHHRQSVSSSHDTLGTAQTDTPNTHTFRSAALESLLPIAAAEGIIFPYTLIPRHTTQVRTPKNPTTRFETSHSELSVLYHRGDVCRHRAAAYAAKGVEPQDTLLQMLEPVRVDGAVEIRETKDWCWRCRVEKNWSRFSGAVMPKSCCLPGVDKADDFERARLVDV